MKRPVATVAITGAFVIVCVPCDLARLNEEDREAVTAIDRAARGATAVGGGNLCVLPSSIPGEVAPGCVVRGLFVTRLGCASSQAFMARVATVALGACISLEGDGYEVVDNTGLRVESAVLAEVAP